MDFFNKFNHFIAYFLPGTVLLIVLLGLVSVILKQNLLHVASFSTGNVTLVLLCSAILGLVIDEVRHTFIEEYFERAWQKLNDTKLPKYDFIAYVPKLGLDVYQELIDDYFHFYEFDINIAMVLLAAAVVTPIYLSVIWSVSIALGLIASLALLALACVMWKCGRHAYSSFLQAFVDLLEHNKITS